MNLNRGLRLSAALLLLATLLVAPANPAGARATGPEGVIAIDIALDESGVGYWIVDQLGRVYAQDGATDYGSVTPAADLRDGETVVSMSATPSGDGYWLFTTLGRVFSFGAAAFYGDLESLNLNQTVVSSVATPSGNGYYMVAKDGGVFALGDARFRGSTAELSLNRPVNGLVPNSSGGYWLVSDDGGIFALGGAPFRGSAGSLKLNQPVIGAIAFSGGYLLVGADGGIFNYSNSEFYGSLGGTQQAAPATAVAGSVAGDRYLIVLADGEVWEFTEAAAQAGDRTGRLSAEIDLLPGPMAITPVYDFVGTRDFRKYSSSANAAWAGAIPGVADIRIPSTADGQLQAAKWLAPKQAGAPLLVVLHSWSGGYTTQNSIPFGRWASQNGWAMIAPNFRGVNNNPSATGSDLAVQDVVDAIDYAVARGADPDRVYAIGYSGGGMMSLLMAGRHPDRFAGVASWVPVYDLPAWYNYNAVYAPQRYYKRHIEASCGGAPIGDSAARNQCVARSPSSYLDSARAAGLPVFLATGLSDTLVPPSDAVLAFNQLADPADRFTPAQVASLGARRLPAELAGQIGADAFFGPEDRQVLMTRKSGSVTFVLFNGAHEMMYEPGLRWFAQGAPSVP
jgi:acetyl esterase/lipase